MCGEIAPVRYEIQRGSGTSFATVYTSEIKMQTTDPVFAPAVVSYMAFANSSDSTPVRIRLMSGQTVVGVVDLTVGQIMGKKNWDVMAPNGQAGRGRLNFRSFEKWERPSFVDYLRSGW